MAVAVEGDAGVGVASDGLDEFDVGAGGDEMQVWRRSWNR
jgi:hypothetical protein